MTTEWKRSQFEPGAPNVFQLFCFAKAPLAADVPMSASRFGLPSAEAMQGVEVREIPRAVDPAWFDGFRGGALRNVAAMALGSLADFDAADTLCAILIERPDAADLVHLQAGWAAAKWLVARGATVVLDAQSNRFWKGSEIADWPAVRPFALSADVNVVVEGEPKTSLANIHTRGLRKFGRPDLVVMNVPGPRWDAVAGILRVLAARQADGKLFKAGDRTKVEHDEIVFSAFTPGPADELHLNNVALELKPA